MYKTQKVYVSLLLLTFCSLFFVQSALAQPESLIHHKKFLGLTLYHDGALFYEKTTASLSQGINQISFDNVSPAILPDTVFISCDNAIVQWFSYVYRPLSVQNLLKAYRGKEIFLTSEKKCGRGCEQRPWKKEAKLLAFGGGKALVATDEGVLQVDTSRIIFPSLPKELTEKPQVRVNLFSSQDGLRPIELVYLAKGFGWSGEYTGILNKDEDRIHITAFANLMNNTNQKVSASDLKLVAGNVNFQTRPFYKQTRMVEDKALAMAAPELPSRKKFFEYHVYYINKKVELFPKERLHLSLFQADELPCQKSLVFRDEGYSYFRNLNRSLRKIHPNIILEIETKKGKEGQPFPAGNFRVYKQDDKGSPVYVGMDDIPGIPAGEKIVLKLGKAFDVTAKKKQTFFKRFKVDNRYGYESSYEIKVFNAKDKPTSVKIIERVPGSWSIIQENIKHKKVDSTHCSWEMTIPPQGTKTLTYSIKVID